VSDLNDPRVLFAAERTLLAWVRTASGLMAMGFLIDRGALMTGATGPSAGIALGIGIAFVAVGVLLSGLSVVQYRRSVATLRPAEIPQNYWVNLAVLTSAAVGALGLLLVLYLIALR
jgi:putative membrane protein